MIATVAVGTHSYDAANGRSREGPSDRRGRWRGDRRRSGSRSRDAWGQRSRDAYRQGSRDARCRKGNRAGGEITQESAIERERRRLMWGWLGDRNEVVRP